MDLIISPGDIRFWVDDFVKYFGCCLFLLILLLSNRGIIIPE